MKLLVSITVLLMSLNGFAKCEYSIDPKDINVSWTAYKTPLKIGVGGAFTKLGVDSVKTGASFGDLLSGIDFKIDATSVSTKDTGRDAKIVKFFFIPMKGGATIKGKTLKYEKKILKVAMTLNGVTKVIPLKVETEKSVFKASGVIDVLDFALSGSLAGINKACEVLHEGKTWSDVAISLSAKYTNTCK